MYTALIAIFPYFEKAFDMDLKPDAKGKVKPKYAKDMKSIMKANLVYFMNGGIYYNDENNNKKAFEFFDQYVNISDSPLLKYGEAANVTAPVDSNYIYAVYYSAIFAAQMDDKEITIAKLTRATKQEFKQNEAFQYLAETYKLADDMENYKKTLTDGLSLFPNEAFFLINMVNIYIESDEHDKALANTLRALQNDPENAQLYNVAGFIYEKIGEKDKDVSKAEEYFLKSIALDGEYEDPQANLGRIYFNQAVAQLEIANEIADVRKYNEEVEKAKTYFRKAQPFYEKAFQLNQTPIDTKIALRNIYYHLGMGDKLAEIEKLMEQ
jgi:tetratricopeptide (TPR) repeat protein